MKRTETDENKWTQEEKDELASKGFRSRRLEEFPPVCDKIRPSDYDNDLRRGTIEFDIAWRNYSYHKVVIQDGTVVRGCNFSQIEPKTDCIIGENLTFIDCNLVNVDIKPSWTVQGCNTSQIWRVEEEFSELVTIDGNQVELKSTIVTNEYISDHPSKVNKLTLIKPDKAITERVF